MARVAMCFQVRVTYEGDENGCEVHPSQVIGIQRSPKGGISTAADAAAHMMKIIGSNPFTGKPVTLIHFKDIDTGEIFSIVSAVPLEGGPFPVSQVPVLHTIHDKPGTPTATPEPTP